MSKARRAVLSLIWVVTLLAQGQTAHADVIEFTDQDEWIAAAGPFSTIDFTEFPPLTFVTDHYSDLGVLFTDGADLIDCCVPEFPNDGAGVDGFGSITLEFLTWQYWISAEYPGALQIDLFLESELVYSSFNFIGVPGGENFAGLLSDSPFDMAIISDPVDGYAGLDDLHFGPPIPGPGGALMLVAAALLGRPGRRRSCCRS